MPSVRIDRFLASTAIALLLSAGAGGALADPMSATAVDATDSASVPPSTAADTDKATAKPDESTDQTQPPPAAAMPAATPDTTGIASAPVDAAPDTTGTASAPVDATPASDATPAPAAATTDTTAPAAAATETPATTMPTPAAAETPAATPQPATGSASAPVDATPATAAAPAPAQNALSSADAAVADQLHDLASGKYDHILGGKKDRITIDAFYSGRDYAPLWLTDGKANARAKDTIAYLSHVDADGLDPADYAVPDFKTLSDPAALAEAELKLTMAVITYAHHAAVGRIHWSRVSPDISFDTKAPEPADVLAAVVESKDLAATLDSYEPHAPGYLALKAKLAEIRGGSDPTKPSIASGPAPRIGAQDDRVPQLRERLGVLGDGGTTYDKAVAEAVKKFQQEHELRATGTLTEATIDALNGRRPDRSTDIILANMERWRWMPHDLGNTYVIVNLPDYTLRVMHDGKQVWMTKIVIGKPDKATPLMTGEMKYITVNPTWNVPPSIVHNEYLPALAQDPTVLERMGLRVSHNPDGSIHISQPPGDHNALGRIRFNFPNKFLVYQHDTPDKYLFAYAKRAYSHGCMRVFDPPKYAEVLLSLVRPGDGYTEERIKRMYGPNEVDIQFPTPIPVHLTYQTAFVDQAGKLEFRDDIYGRDRTLLALMKGGNDERRVADIAVEHKDNIVRRQVLAVPDQPSLWGEGRNYPGARANGYAAAPQPDGQNFFARLFGLAPQQQQQQQPVAAPLRRRVLHRTGQHRADDRRTELQ